MMRRFSVLIFVGLLVSWSSVASAQRLGALPAADPLDLSSIDKGIGVRAGDAMALANFNDAEFSTVISATPHAVLRLKAYDAAASSFGEFITYPAPTGVTARTPVDFSGANANNGRLSRRVDDLVDEIDQWSSDAGTSGFETTTIVVDFWRWRADWWVRWDGNLDSDANRVGQGPYGFYRKEMVDDLLNDIEIAAQTHQPRYMIIGHEIERVLATETSGGLAPAELSNFMAFYQEAIARIRSVSPETKVGAGFQWDRFVKRVAPLYAKSESASELETLDRAFQAVMLPFIERSDVVALSSYARPGEERTDYQYLRRIEDLYGVASPVVYYSVGSPVESTVAYLDQKNYLEQFLTWNAGVNVELIAWSSMLNLDGTDTNDQVVTGRCEAFTGTAREFETPLSFCYDGLFTSVFTKKPILDLLIGE